MAAGGRDYYLLIQSYVASKWQNWDLNPSNQYPASPFLRLDRCTYESTNEPAYIQLPNLSPCPYFFFFLPCSICCQAYSVKGFQIRVLRWSLSDSLVSTLTSSRNSSWEVLVAIAKKNSFPPSSTGWFPNLSYGFGSVNSVNLRAKTQFRVTNEGYSVAAGAKLCCSYPSGFSASREATGIYLYISPPNLRQTAHTKVSGIIQSRS